MVNENRPLCKAIFSAPLKPKRGGLKVSAAHESPMNYYTSSSGFRIFLYYRRQFEKGDYARTCTLVRFRGCPCKGFPLDCIISQPPHIVKHYFNLLHLAGFPHFLPVLQVRRDSTQNHED